MLLVSATFQSLLNFPSSQGKAAVKYWAITIMAQFLDLPTELLLAIVACFHPVDDRKLLLSLCRVSRRTCAAVQPMLFSQFVAGPRCIHCNPRDEETKHDNECRLEPLVPFARTIVARPDLALRVQKLVIREHACTPEPLREWPNALTAETVRYLTKAVQTLGVKNGSRWLSAIAGCVFDPFIAVLISQAANVRELSIMLDWKRLHSFFVLSRQMLRGSARFPYLGNLISLDINCYDKKAIELQSILPVLSLPQLREVSVAHCWGVNQTEWPEIAPGALKLSAITLSPACIDGRCLTRLIAACACLKRFAYVVMADKQVDSVQPQEIQPALYPQRHNLEELQIEYRPMWREAITNPNIFPKYGSFRDFSNLRCLDVEQALLVPAGRLPESLEVLVIEQAGYPVFDMMTALVSNRPTQTPSLHEILIVPYLLAPYAMVGLHRYRGADYFGNGSFWTVLGNARGRLESIVDGTGTRLAIDGEAWQSR